jgi:hypothetical protein
VLGEQPSDGAWLRDEEACSFGCERRDDCVSHLIGSTRRLTPAGLGIGVLTMSHTFSGRP